MTCTASGRGSGRRKKSATQILNTQQKQLGLGNGSQCLPDVERNTGIETEDRISNLKAAVLMRIQSIKLQGFINEEMATEAKATADLIEKYGKPMLYGKYFIKTAWAIAILSFQKDGYKAFGFNFKSELKSISSSSKEDLPDLCSSNYAFNQYG